MFSSSLSLLLSSLLSSSLSLSSLLYFFLCYAWIDIKASIAQIRRVRAHTWTDKKPIRPFFTYFFITILLYRELFYLWQRKNLIRQNASRYEMIHIYLSPVCGGWRFHYSRFVQIGGLACFFPSHSPWIIIPFSLPLHVYLVCRLHHTNSMKIQRIETDVRNIQKKLIKKNTHTAIAIIWLQ